MNKDPKDVMVELDSKFSSNFKKWISLGDPKLDKAFIGLRCIAEIGTNLSLRGDSKHHEICCTVYDEIFSDGVISIYLASNAMDKPAHIVLRRVLELGLAAIYLWDMPHRAFSWNIDDESLSFSEMLKHVNSGGYLAYINSENKTNISGEIIPSSRVQKLYGMLSDVVHGKITTFESSMPNRYEFVEDEWFKFIELIDEIISILVKAFLLRFGLEHVIFEKLPMARKVFG